MTRTLVFIDSRVADHQSLIAGLGPDTTWVLLDANRDGIAQMRSALAGHSGLDSIQIVSHGSVGSVLLGSTVLDANSLGGYEAQLKAIGASLSDTGDLLLYGCNVAQGDAGASFINQLGQLTGADVAASTDLTGLGGNWVLEAATGAIEAAVLAPVDYSATLRVITGTAGADTLGGLSGSNSAYGAVRYSVTFLDTPGGTGSSYAQGINDSGQVVGNAYVNRATHAAIWNGTAVTDLGTLGGTNSFGGGINNSGQVVGGSHTAGDYAFRAFIWSGTAATDLGGTDSNASGINDSGQVVGAASTLGKAGYRAVIWNGTAATDLGTLGGTYSSAQGINNSGQVVGYAYTAGNVASRAVIWNGTAATDLGSPLGGTSSGASGINDSGQVVGWAYTAGNAASHAVIWNGTAATDLGTLGGIYSTSLAQGINNSGQVVGWAYTAGNAASHAVIWNGTEATDLNSYLDQASVDSGWVLERATDINDNGWIVGYATNSQRGEGRGYVLSALPEPASVPTSDTLIGGAGDDTYIVDDAGDVVIELTGEGTDQVNSSVSYTLADNVENLTLTGADPINGTGNALANMLTGNGAANTLDGGAGTDTAQYAGAMAGYRFGLNARNQLTVTDVDPSNGDDGTDTLINVEQASFVDGTVNLHVQVYGETLVNTTTAASMTSPIIAALSGGGYVVAWSSYVEDANGNDIYAQRYDSVGAPVGGETRANATTAGGQSYPGLIGLADGGYVVLWQSEGQDGSGWGIFSQGYDALGAPIGGEQLVNSAAISSQGFADGVALTGGGYVVVWESAPQDGSGYGIYAQRYDAAGVKVGNETQINTTPGNDQRFPVVTALADGGYVVAWQSYAQDGSGYSIYAQRYDAAGAALGGETQVNTTTADSQQTPAIAALTGGGYVVTWESVGQDGSGFGIYAQRYDAAGVKVGGEAQINTTTANDQRFPVVSALADGGYAVAWQSYAQDGSGYGIYAQRFNAAGAALGSETLVNTSTTNDQTAVAITTLADGGYVMTWGSYGMIYSQRYDAAGGTRGILLSGDANANTLTWSGGGSVTLDGCSGNDTLAGGVGDSIYVVDDAGDVVIELAGEGTDQVNSSASHTLGANVENLTLTGSAAINGTGNALANVITGNSEGNTLDGGAGADTLIGGDGSDTYVVDDADDVVTETNPTAASGGTDLVNASLTYTLGANVENLTLTGSAAINGTGNALANVITGNSAANVLDGGAGADTLTGGDGSDTYVVDNADDVVTETNATAASGGTDLVNSSISQTLGANVENLTLTGSAAINGTGNELANAITGNSADNVLEGSAGADTLDGGAGADTLIGGDGSDTYVVDNAGDVVSETNDTALDGGTDQVNSSISYTLGAHVENLTLTGLDAINGTGNDLANVITGNEASNLISGGLGHDSLYGEQGDDTLDGGGGDDWLVGGGGKDTVRFSGAYADYVLSGHGGQMEVTDPEGTAHLNGIEALVFADATVRPVFVDAGVDVKVNAAPSTNLGRPSVVTLADGGWLVTRFATGSLNGTYCQRYGADGAAMGAEFRAGSHSGDGNFSGPSVTALADGGWLVGGRRYNADGVRVGDQLYQPPSLAALGDGGWVWVEAQSEGSGGALQIIGQRYDADGVATESQFQVNPPTGSAVDSPTITALTDGGWVVAWHSNGLDGAGAGIFVQRYDQAGTASGAAVQANADATLSQSSPCVTALMDGGWVVTWAGGNGVNDILGQSFGADGLPSGPQFQINTSSGTFLEWPAVTALADGGWVVTWSYVGAGGFGQGDSFDAYAQRYSSTGEAIGSEFRINTTAHGDQALASISALPDGGWVVAWLAGDINTSQNWDVYTQRYSADGLPWRTDLGLDITGDQSSQMLAGYRGNDTLDGAGGADTLMGGAGDDTYLLDNSAGAVVLEMAGEGTDQIISSLSYTLTDNLENLTLTGSAAIDATGNSEANVLTGNDASNVLSGDLGNDTLYGGGGDDNLNGGAGVDSMVGGSGSDTYFVDASGDVVVEASGDPLEIDLVRASVSVTLATNVENLVLMGAANISGVGNALANAITGNSGNNSLSGNAGNDVIGGGDGNDTLNGGTGNDTLDGGGGNDSLVGGAGNDVYVVDSVSDRVVEVSTLITEIDRVSASVSYTIGANVEQLTLAGTSHINGVGNTLANVLVGNSGNNSLSGGAGNDSISGGDGNDVLNGGTGADTLIGGDGSDTYAVDNAGDVVTETNATATSGGTDLVNASVSFTLGANVENLTLTGSVSINATGNVLANVITGNAAANLIDGAAGADTLVGGDGSDTYVVDNAGDVVTEANATAASGGTDLVNASVSYTLGSNVENLLLTGSAAINGTGNALANVITGNTAANTLDGGAGADSLIGGDGSDTYVVDNAGDVVIETNATAASGGADLVNASVNYTLGANVENLTLTGSDAINGTGNELANRITGTAAGNVLDGGAGADTLIGGDGSDTYVVDNAADVVTETNAAAASGGIDVVNSSVSFTLGSNVESLTLTGSDAINGTGNALANVITGNAAANALDGGAGADTLVGGDGSDTYAVDNAGDVVTETNATAASGGTDLVNASVSYTLGANVENLTLTGSAAINGTGNELANVITGNAAANKLDGGAGADAMIGGDGSDTYAVDNAGDVVTETNATAASGGADLVNASVNYTLGANVENLTLTGSDAINGTGNELANRITGNATANVLNGGAGADTLIGGDGSDTYVVDNAGDVVTETNAAPASGGIDLVNSSVSFTIGTNVESLTLTGSDAINGTGNALANVLTGNAAANTLDGGAGADTLVGGDGSDTYVVDNAGDVVTETNATASSGGTDLISSNVSLTLVANVENLTLTGSAAINGSGNSLANVITGNTGANALRGGDGADTLIGGLGADLLTGGTGADTFRFVTTADGSDTITDFTSGTDKIYIVAANFGLKTGAGANLVINGTPSSAAAAFVYSTTTGVLGFDSDGNGAGAAMQLATLSNKSLGFKSSDFVFGA